MFAVIKAHFCTKAMVARLEEHPDYETKIEDNPFVMLETIKQLMHDPQRSQYYIIQPLNAMRRVLNNKQGPNEPLMDYIKRSKQDHGMLMRVFGERDGSIHLVEQQPDYRKSNRTQTNRKS